MRQTVIIVLTLFTYLRIDTDACCKQLLLQINKTFMTILYHLRPSLKFP